MGKDNQDAVELTTIRGLPTLDALQHPAGDRIIQYLTQYREQSQHVIDALERQVVDGRQKVLELDKVKDQFRSIDEHQELEFLKLQNAIADKKIVFERLISEICEETIADVCRNPERLEYEVSVPDFVAVFEKIVRSDERSLPLVQILTTLETSLYSTLRFMQHRADSKRRSGKGFGEMSAAVQQFLPEAEKRVVLLSDEQLAHVDAFMRSASTSEDHVSKIKYFVEELVSLSAGEDGSVDPEIVAAVEDAVYPRFYAQLMDRCRMLSREEDEEFSSRTLAFGSISQHALYIAPDFISRQPLPYIDAIAYLRTVYFTTTPTRKLRVFLHAAEAVYEAMRQMRKQNNSKVAEIAADEFLPVLIFVVLKARVQDVCSQLTFVKEYASDRFMNGEMGYYLSSVELAVEYIKTLSADKLCPSHVASLGKRFVFAECERFRSWASHDRHVRVVDANAVLPGYRLYCVRDWVLSPARLFCTILQYTGNPDDKVKVVVISATESATESQLEFLAKTFLQPLPTSGLCAEDTVLGSALVFSTQEWSSHPALKQLSIMHVSDGDFDTYYSATVPELVADRVVDSKALCSATSASTLTQVVSYVQEGLLYLDIMLSLLPNRGGVLEDMTMFGIMQYQKTRALSNITVGKLDLSTLKALQHEIGEIASLLTRISYLPPQVAPSRYDIFSVLIEGTKKFQKDTGLFPDGRMGKKTRDTLTRIVQGGTSTEEERLSTTNFLRQVSLSQSDRKSEEP